jgi:isoquinoline 1-oxidoreductase
VAERDLEVRALQDGRLGRRDFFGILGRGLVVVLGADGDVWAQESGSASRRDASPQGIQSWIHVGEDGRVTVYTGKVDVGQNSRTSLSQVVAEELRVPIGSIQMMMGDTDLVPYDMGTSGSRTTPTMAPQIRKAAAAARQALIGAAALQLKADAGSLVARDGRVLDPRTQRSLGYGELTRGKPFEGPIPPDTPLTAVGEWKVEGHSIPKITGPDIVRGTHIYPSDVRRPGMLSGRVLRPKAFGARLLKLDSAAAEALPGVGVVHEGSFVGVVAKTEHEASAARDAIRAEWSEGTPGPSSADLFPYLRKNAEASSEGGHRQGSLDEGWSLSKKRFEATYTVAYIAHTPLEPRAAVAEWNDGRLTVWTGTQRPFAVRSELAQAFGIGEDRVRVLVPDTGSAYGGKHTGETAVEAARLARAAGKPVKVVWTREEEFTWAYFRPAGVIDVQSGVSADGRLVGWEFHNYNSGPAGIATPYAIPHQAILFHESRSPLRQGSYRGLAATANHFARESHMDEVAHAVGVDPLLFRRRHIEDPRLRAVLDAAAKGFGWGEAAPARHGHGLACGVEKGGYIATCAEVAIEPETGEIRIVRATAAFECGAILNPDHLKNQVEGAVMMGVGGALFESIDFEAGAISNPHLALYRVPRFADAPLIQTILLDRPDLPSAGAGETPIVCLAPAVANAAFALTGRRRRSLPLNRCATPDPVPGCHAEGSAE